MLRKLMWSACCLLAANGMASAAWQFELQAWAPELNGEARVSDNGNAGTLVELADPGAASLQLGDEAVPEFRATYRAGDRHRFRALFSQFDFSGFNPNATFTFGGETFAAQALTSDLQVKMGRGGWTWDWLQSRRYSFGTGLDVNYLDIRGSVVAADGTFARADVKAFLPTVNAGLEVYLSPSFTLFGAASGITAGTYGHLLDAEAGLRVQPAKELAIKGGYRWLDLKVEDEDNGDRVKFGLQGPFFGVELNY